MKKKMTLEVKGLDLSNQSVVDQLIQEAIDNRIKQAKNTLAAKARGTLREITDHLEFAAGQPLSKYAIKDIKSYVNGVKELLALLEQNDLLTSYTYWGGDQTNLGFGPKEGINFINELFLIIDINSKLPKGIGTIKLPKSFTKAVSAKPWTYIVDNIKNECGDDLKTLGF